MVAVDGVDDAVRVLFDGGGGVEREDAEHQRRRQHHRAVRLRPRAVTVTRPLRDRLRGRLRAAVATAVAKGVRGRVFPGVT